jgi:hypothetical protein
MRNGLKESEGILSKERIGRVKNASPNFWDILSGIFHRQ